MEFGNDEAAAKWLMSAMAGGRSGPPGPAGAGVGGAGAGAGGGGGGGGGGNEAVYSLKLEEEGEDGVIRPVSAEALGMGGMGMGGMGGMGHGHAHGGRGGAHHGHSHGGRGGSHHGHSHGIPGASLLSSPIFRTLVAILAVLAAAWYGCMWVMAGLGCLGQESPRGGDCVSSWLAPVAGRRGARWVGYVFLHLGAALLAAVAAIVVAPMLASSLGHARTDMALLYVTLLIGVPLIIVQLVFIMSATDGVALGLLCLAGDIAMAIMTANAAARRVKLARRAAGGGNSPCCKSKSCPSESKV